MTGHAGSVQIKLSSMYLSPNGNSGSVPLPSMACGSRAVFLPHRLNYHYRYRSFLTTPQESLFPASRPQVNPIVSRNIALVIRTVQLQGYYPIVQPGISWADAVTEMPSCLVSFPPSKREFSENICSRLQPASQQASSGLSFVCVGLDTYCVGTAEDLRSLQSYHSRH